jgi:hypothetical protein
MTWGHGGTVIVGDEPSHSDEPAASRPGAAPRSPSLSIDRPAGTPAAGDTAGKST